MDSGYYYLIPGILVVGHDEIPGAHASYLVVEVGQNTRHVESNYVSCGEDAIPSLLLTTVAGSDTVGKRLLVLGFR